MGLFSKDEQTRIDLSSGPPIDPKWTRNRKGSFHRFVQLDPEEEGLGQIGGVYILWHKGVKPAWVFVGYTKDLAATFHELANNDDIMQYEVNGGLYVTWSLVLENYRPGVVMFLNKNISPKVETTSTWTDKDVPIPVYVPGAEPK